VICSIAFVLDFVAVAGVGAGGAAATPAKTNNQPSNLKQEFKLVSYFV